MAVITRYIVVRKGVELETVFDNKKDADAYDKMLDAAEQLAEFIKGSDLEPSLEASLVDKISIYLAENAPAVTKILKGIKPAAAKPPKSKTDSADAGASRPRADATAGETKTKTKRKSGN